jgi:hypothetical protein
MAFSDVYGVNLSRKAYRGISLSLALITTQLSISEKLG